jgi:hypothetical protein
MGYSVAATATILAQSEDIIGIVGMAIVYRAQRVLLGRRASLRFGLPRRPARPSADANHQRPVRLTQEAGARSASGALARVSSGSLLIVEEYR